MNSSNKPAMFLKCCADGKHCHSVKGGLDHLLPKMEWNWAYNVTFLLLNSSYYYCLL